MTFQTISPLASPDRILDGLIETANGVAQRRAARAAAEMIVESRHLHEPVVATALEMIRAGQFGDSPTRRRLEELSFVADVLGWRYDRFRESEQHLVDRDDQHAAERARALDVVWFALDGNSRQGALAAVRGARDLICRNAENETSCVMEFRERIIKALGDLTLTGEVALVPSQKPGVRDGMEKSHAMARITRSDELEASAGPVPSWREFGRLRRVRLRGHLLSRDGFSELLLDGDSTASFAVRVDRVHDSSHIGDNLEEDTKIVIFGRVIRAENAQFYADVSWHWIWPRLVGLNVTRSWLIYDAAQIERGVQIAFASAPQKHQETMFQVLAGPRGLDLYQISPQQTQD